MLESFGKLEVKDYCKVGQDEPAQNCIFALCPQGSSHLLLAISWHPVVLSLNTG